MGHPRRADTPSRRSRRSTDEYWAPAAVLDRCQIVRIVGRLEVEPLREPRECVRARVLARAHERKCECSGQARRARSGWGA